MKSASQRPLRRRLPWLAGLALLAFGAWMTFAIGPAPRIELAAAGPAIGPRTVVGADFATGRRGLAEIRLELIQGERVVELAEAAHPPRAPWRFWSRGVETDRLAAEVGWQTLDGLTEETATIRATAAHPGTWLRRPAAVVRELSLPVRLHPPALVVTSRQHYPAQGGAGVVVYRAGDSAIRDGVGVGELFFGGHPLPGAEDGRRFALFAVPFDHDEVATIRLEAEDDAGNVAATRFVDRLLQRPASSDRLRVSDAFLERVVPAILERSALASRGSLVEDYLVVNRELRQSNSAELVALGARSKGAFAWSQPFLPLPNGQVMSPFADRRTYVYDEREIDHQVHLGYDLASVRRAAVPAANDGTVLLARYFGIYGNAVLIDHGFGLTSLYGHLSSLEVSEGDLVARGQTIGRTGETGLAGGDHLHFTMLVGGVPVDPKEWWDPEWIAERVGSKLGLALGSAP